MAFLIRVLFIAAAIYFFGRLLTGLRAFGDAVTGKRRQQQFKGKPAPGESTGPGQGASGRAGSATGGKRFEFKDDDVLDVSYQAIEEGPERSEREPANSTTE